MRKLITSSLFIFYFSVYCLSQFQVSYGIKAGYINFGTLFVCPSTVIEGAVLSGSDRLKSSYQQALCFASLVRSERKKWSLQAELAYCTAMVGAVFILEGPRDFTITRPPTSYKNIELSLDGGFKPFKFLRVFTGFGMWYQFTNDKDPYNRGGFIYPEEPSDPLYEYRKESNQIYRIAQGVEKSHIPFVLVQKFGAGLEIKRFSFDITYERSLTLVRKEIEYLDNKYPFRVSSSRFLVSLGYRFYNFRFGKSKAEK